MGSDSRQTNDSKRRTWLRGFALALLVIAALASVFFAFRTFGSYRLLHSATEIGAPKTSTIRAWMTLGYVADTYGVPSEALAERLQLASNTDPQRTLKALAEAKGIGRLEFVQSVQRAIADATPAQTSTTSGGWLSTLSEAVLSAILTSGYVALGATLLLGAFGFPLPDGLAAILAGSLAAQGRLDLWAVLVLGVGASTMGDLGNFALGRLIGPTLVAKHGRWIGLTANRRSFITNVLARWGAAAILVSRTLASSFSTIISVLAGAADYSAPRFVALALLGRTMWTLAYVWLGYTVGKDLDAAASFLLNLTACLLTLLLCAAGWAIWTKAGTSRPITSQR